jgi:hypothetical protein
VRPDGFIGFRAATADAASVAALDAHLAQYLVPNNEPGCQIPRGAEQDRASGPSK